jgi:hypothetical protein
MIENSMDSRAGLEQVFWYGIIGISALVVGYLLAQNITLLVLGAAGLAWLVTLPYHGTLSIVLSVATFSSALIMPAFPGRPYIWEFAALLGWTGFVMILFMRRYSEDSYSRVMENRWLFIGVISYCAVLLVTMRFRGFGLRILGGDLMGGRFYFQQLVCAIFPLLFAMVRIEEKTLVRLFALQCILTATYLVSDFVFSYAPRSLYVLLQFFELPGDAVNFEMQNMRFGIRRFQSLNSVSQGMLFLLLIRYNLKEFFSLRSFYLLPLAVVFFSLGLMSGHRILVLTVCTTVFFCAIAQRFFKPGNITIAAAVVALSLTLTYGYADRFPLAAQRAVSFLPGISLEHLAKDDGLGTIATRRLLIQAGLELMPQYFWLGRGFGRYVDHYAEYWQTGWVTAHLNQGVFFNGFIGLMINTGIWGTLSMFTFLGAGTVIVLRIIRHLRRFGCEDQFSRMCSVLIGMWMANVLAFIFLHGDSEYAMKSFSLQSGVLLVCDYHLKRRAAARLAEQ